MAQAISDNIPTFIQWFSNNDGRFHPNVSFQAGPSGYSVIATQDIPSDTTVVSCPFNLAVTPDVSRRALISVLGSADTSLSTWSERQLICSYLCLHWIFGESRYHQDVLAHWPYLKTLPSADKLRTPLHFTSTELEAFRGSNLYGATLDRHRDWQQEWTQCRGLFSTVNSAWAGEFTWERYLTAATYLSSRAFPSTLLSPEPSLAPTSSSHPVLLPGVDALNHARAHPVSWVVSNITAPNSLSSENTQTISLVLRTSTASGQELFNNYGPKPNAELILGYGFSLPENPDDTIVLKIGGNPAGSASASQPKYEVGRNASGADPVWNTVLAAICGDPEESTVEDELDGAEMLAEMVENLRNRLPQPGAAGQDLRPEVATMLEHYLEGQREILHSLIAFARDKERQAIQKAREQGLQIVDEEAEEEE
ncbi:SET domain-containing protein [Daedalea quercina L-15889]|uniref:SET domain-containing protein n=1 Tax=Daedalea quercina L-15889 TaxID=1314783 RepID=A0A165QG56_9APHY|nr:SET domain-containing protein [Daedalea quercina L-15889]